MSRVEGGLERRGFGRKLGVGPNPALLVVDMIEGFTDPDAPLGADLAREIAAIGGLLSAVRAMSWPVIFTTTSYSEPDCGDAGLWLEKVEGIRTLLAGTPAVEVDGRLGRLTTEPVVVKKYASAFFGTDLCSRLNAARVDTVLVAGCTTSGCVRATAVDALQLGFRPIVVADCVGDRSVAAHDQSLADLASRYADVESSESLLAVIARRTDGASASQLPVWESGKEAPR